MRIEQVHFFLYGALLLACGWGITRTLSSAQARLHLRAVFLALGLGVIVVPGHGEFIAAPILAVLVPPWRSHLLVLDGVFFLLWWAAAFGLLRWLSRRHSRRLSGRLE